MKLVSIAAGAGAAGLLGLGLYVAAPAFAADPAPSASPTAPHARPGKDHPGKRHPFRHARAFRGVHGEATVKRKDGFHLATWQRGKITSVSSGGVTVRSEDGVSWTWAANGDTRVRKDGEKSALKALANGDQVLVAGERSGSTRTARLIRVPKHR
ncbi:hypothetical protein HUT06_01600 [Actinomadura sp. NAK00032]|uniref:DUF5666 domain-containing protein n=1 Tax=Actinomadura sp. NAK00032 TaxID=2742128 RepID=UPI0015915BBF|nr:DUF5666 domain-containing protein [Actinomadura sp. NAK00032]QKW32890.1 hypothetical protein HUT06_01600 [Actinomadura sp. NAK00032]